MSLPSPVSVAVSADILIALERLIAIVAQLRSPQGGCPWDLAQTPQSLVPYVIEEAYEVVAAIHSEEQGAIAEELGDLLLQVVLQAQIASEMEQFTLADVAQGIADKLVRRHPHVFDESRQSTTEAIPPEQVRQNWEQMKAAEQGRTLEETQRLSYQLRRYGRSLPPLLACSKISQKAAQAGLEWESVDGVWEKFQEELAEFQVAIATEDRAHQQAELGDLLFTVVNLARWYGLDPSEALSQTNQRFTQRLAVLETLADRPLSDYTLKALEALWQRAKAQLAQEHEAP